MQLLPQMSQSFPLLDDADAESLRQPSGLPSSEPAIWDHREHHSVQHELPQKTVGIRPIERGHTRRPQLVRPSSADRPTEKQPAARMG